MARCIPAKNSECATVGYSIIGDPQKNTSYAYIHDIMKVVAEKNDMEVGSDVKLLTIGKSSDFKEYIL